jgi:hypothetical protein
MKGKRATTQPMPGPQRWKYRNYSIHEGALPFGRRYEVRSPQDELILVCRSRRSDARLLFFADEKESVELFRFEPRTVRQFHRSYEAVDSLTGQPFGLVRKRSYAPTRKVEWFVFDTDANQIGLITETAASPSLLRRILPMDRFLPKAWAVHWGQAIAGTLQPKLGVMGERLELDLRFDTRDEIDRRLVLGTAVALRADLRRPEKTEKPAPEAKDAEPAQA